TEAVIINETFASRHFPNEDPIGRALLIETLAPNVDDSGKPAARQIVGIVADVRGEPLRAASQPAIYLPLDQSPIRFISLAVRARGDPLAIAETVRRAIAAEDKELPASDVRSMESRLAGLLAGPRNATALAGALAVLAVVLASLGVYGTLSFNTARRTQEIGVRFALGARQGQVLGLVLSECALVAVFGIVPGAALSFAAARLIESQLFDVSPTDPLTFIAVCAGLMTTALVSGLAPAMRAARVDPMTALRHD
ncbi:MAG: FtsX-like permease family protein, partial [Bryobacteraceae bacterium]